MHETFLRFGVVKDLLERRVLQGGTVDISCDPVVVKDRGTLYAWRAILNQSLSRGNHPRATRLTISSWNM